MLKMDLSLSGLLFLIATAAANPSKNFGYTHIFESNDGFPSCGELRDLWSALSQSMQISHLTNEIPLLPRELMDFKSLKSLSRNGPLQKEAATSGWSQRPSIQDILLSGAGVSDKPTTHGFSSENHPTAFQSNNPNTYYTPESLDQNVEFLEFDKNFETEPVPSGYFGSSSENTNARFLGKEFESQWGLPEDIGTFGRFVKDGENSLPIAKLLSPTADRKNHRQTINLEQRNQDVKQTICASMVNIACTSQKQCSCPGRYQLDCERGRCTPRHPVSEPVNDFTYWHNGPLARAQLGMASLLRKKRYSRSIFM